MDNNTVITIIAILIALVVAVAVMGPRLKSVNFNLLKLFSAGAQANEPKGAKVEHNKVEGDLNQASAQGDGSSVSHNTIKGSGNTFDAKP